MNYGNAVKASRTGVKVAQIKLGSRKSSISSNRSGSYGRGF